MRILEDSSIDLQPSSVIRAGAISGFLYTAVIIATTLYVESQPLPATKSKLSSAANDQILLRWVNQHTSLMDVYMLSALAGFLLLGCVAFAIFTMLRRPGARVPLIGAIVAVAGLALSLIASVLERVDYVHYAQQYVDAHVPAAVDSVVKSFESAANRDYGIDTSGRFAVVFWIGIVGLSLMSLYGWRSTPVLGSFATFFVGVLGFTPVFALWSAGAGFGLWRVAAGGLSDMPMRDISPEYRGDSEVPQSGRFTLRRPRRSQAVDAEATVMEESVPVEYAAPVRSQAEPEPEPVMIETRPPRGTSVPRQVPGHARGSKTSQPRKRR